MIWIIKCNVFLFVMLIGIPYSSMSEVIHSMGELKHHCMAINYQPGHNIKLITKLPLAIM